MKKLLFTTLVLLISITFTQAQNKEEKTEKEVNLKLEVKDGANPDVYVDGKKFDFPLHLLDPNKIATMSVIKGQEAIDVYNAPNGVILITTKEPTADGTSTFTIKNNDAKDTNTEKTEIRIRDKDAKNPMIIIDGKKSSKVELKKLKAEQIDVIEVVKDEKAKEEYNSDSGVIIIKTKKAVKTEKEAKEEK